MKFGIVLEDFIQAKRFSSKSSERHYRDCLEYHAEIACWRDPRMTTAKDVEKTLARWKHPNTADNRLSIMSSFYSWMTRKQLRKDNPAHQVERIRRRDPETKRLTHDEVLRLLAACETRRERWLVSLGVFAGLRSAELRGLTGRHLKRQGFIHVSSDIAKGGKERWVPVAYELEPLVAEMQERLDTDHFVLPAQRKAEPGEKNNAMKDYPTKPCSAQSLWRLVKKVADRAGIEANPHAMRHAYADHLVRWTSIHNVKALMGHRSIETTQGYTDKPTLDELAAAVEGFRLGGVRGYEPGEAANPLVARRGFEPLLSLISDPERNSPLGESIQALLEERVPLYVNHFGELEAA